jgi:hypothetical protein
MGSFFSLYVSRRGQERANNESIFPLFTLLLESFCPNTLGDLAQMPNGSRIPSIPVFQV